VDGAEPLGRLQLARYAYAEGMLVRHCAAALRWPLAIALVVLLGSCGDEQAGGQAGSGGTGGTEPPVQLDPTDFTYELEESSAELALWTAPATHKVRTHERAPEARRSGLRLSAARHELEPVQLLLGPASGTVTASIDPFPDLGSAQRLELAVVGYEAGWAEHLTPLGATGSVALSDGHAVPLWLTVYVPDDAPAGDHQSTLHLTPSAGAAIAVPVRLRVFDFALPQQIGFATQLNVSIAELIPDGGEVDDAKTLLFEHRLTPKSVTWPSGFHWDITWDNPSSSDRCELFWDEPDEPDPYSIGWLARRYILGEGWNGVGFPNAMAFQFVDNATPRPDNFCGLDRGDHDGSAEYNAEWQQFLGALQGYLVEHGYIDKAYYYVQNEPQNEADHRLAAHLCRLIKQAAPELRIAISEEPKPEIAEDSEGACGYDIWIAHIRAYQQDYAHQRQQEYGETVWLYSLDHDPDPYFNPTLVERQGIHQRIIPWVSWHVRATGWAYYDAGRFFDGLRPTVRAELLREGIEDWEYLALANQRAGGGAVPEVLAAEPVDPTVDSVASSLTSWTRNPDALMALRHELGLYIEGSRESLPLLEAPGTGRPRDRYFINFQDPTGQPTAEPLVVGGNTYLKIGWQPYRDDDGYGWYGEYVGEPSIALYGYDEVDGYDEVQSSYLYDDYGRDNLFEFSLENGRYEVTMGAGRPARGYPNDPHNLTIEGSVVIDDEPTSDAEPTIERTVTVDLTDGRLSVEMGGRSASTGEWSYTFLAYLHIVPAS